MPPDRKSVEHGLKLATGFEAALKEQTSMMVQLAIQATTKGMNSPEMERLLNDQKNALIVARASGMLFIAMAKRELGELVWDDAVLEEMDQLEDKRDEALKELMKERE